MGATVRMVDVQGNQSDIDEININFCLTPLRLSFSEVMGSLTEQVFNTTFSEDVDSFVSLSEKIGVSLSLCFIDNADIGQLFIPREGLKICPWEVGVEILSKLHVRVLDEKLTYYLPILSNNGVVVKGMFVFSGKKAQYISGHWLKKEYEEYFFEENSPTKVLYMKT